MIFYVSPIPEKITYPCVVLIYDNWNDYGYKTYFHMSYYYNEKKFYELGGVKILKKGSKFIDLKEFQVLDHQYCSLGQSLRYYSNIKNLGEDIYTTILESLNDIIIDPDLAESEGFEQDPGFKDSLVRFSEPSKIYENRYDVLEEQVDINQDYKSKIIMYPFKTLLNPEELRFNFSTRLPRAEYEHTIDFNFSLNEDLPYRISVLIGKNGTGKTQLLARIANSLSGFDNAQGNFEPRKPAFSKIIAISYSAFDDFEIPKKGMDISFKYCGVRNKSGVISTRTMRSKMKQAYNEIQKDNTLLKKWRNLLTEVTNSTIVKEVERYLKGENSLSIELSSGQHMLVRSITDVIAFIERDTLLLIDEPELHLHPNAISNYINMLYMLLDEFKSYAIISTHSPIVLQEVPSKYVRVVERRGRIPIVKNLWMESFGENLSTITTQVFETINTKSNYRSWLKNLLKRKSYEDILEVFDNKLSLNAKIFIKNYSPTNQPRDEK